jgi:hypothetical protein
MSSPALEILWMALNDTAFQSQDTNKMALDLSQIGDGAIVHWQRR